MSKYIDADKILDIIIKMRKEYATQEVTEEHKGLRAVLGGQCLVLTEIIEIIDSIQQEQQEVDEDFFFDEVLKVYDDNNKYPPRSEEELTILETIARHFWSKGYSARKEE